MEAEKRLLSALEMNPSLGGQANIEIFIVKRLDF